MKKLFKNSFLILTFTFLPLFNILAQEKSEPEPGFWSWLWSVIEGEFENGHSRPQQENTFELMNDLHLKINLKGVTKFKIGDNLKWKESDYDDSSWDKIRVPSQWENEGFNGYDGYAWYRMSFDGSMLSPSDIHFLVLGFIDDMDEVYLNGVLIGKSGVFPPNNKTAYNSFRKYSIPSDLINYKRNNTLAIRVYDEYGDGGIIRGDIGIYISKKPEDLHLSQNLSGIWEFSRGIGSTYNDEKINNANWEDILVPSYWDNHGYKTLDGYAWYKKDFTLSFQKQSGKNYYLVLGKIDDFDETYLNGIKIGETNDAKGFGYSQSYLKTRVYKIPANVLKENQTNQLLVKVYDLGYDGGIYKGPIGIYEEKELIHIEK